MQNKDFKFINSHEKVSAVRDTSKNETIKKSLRERLNNSKNMLLLVGETTRLDTDFVPYEINFAIHNCKIPIIVCYVKEDNRIVSNIPAKLKRLWPDTLKNAMDNNEVRTIHIPFREKVIEQALNDFSISNPPKYAISLYKTSVYDKCHIV